MKACTSCKQLKDEDQFYPDSRKPGKTRSKCKVCVNETNKLWASKNRAKRRSKGREYYEENRDRLADKRMANRDTKNAKMREYYEQNKGAFILRNKLRKSLINGMPTWVSEDPYKSGIQAKYREARDTTEHTGVKYVVDHIVPLNHPLICGLHVPWNLQVITSAENDAKGNKWNETDQVGRTPDEHGGTCK